MEKETDPQGQETEATGQQAGFMASVWGIVWSVSSYFSSSQEQAVQDALKIANEGNQEWPANIPPEVWQLIAVHASEENISTLVHLSRVNKFLNAALKPYVEAASETFATGSLSESELKNRIRVVTTQQALIEALRESEVHLILIEITQGNEKEFVIEIGKEFSDTKVEAIGAVNVLVKYPGFEITAKQGATVSVYDGCVGHASQQGSVRVYQGARGEARDNGFVTVYEGGKGYAYSDGFITITEGSEGHAYAQGHVTVQHGGVGYASKDGHVTVKDGGYGNALNGGHVTVEAGGEGRADVEGSKVVVQNGGKAFAKNKGAVTVESGGEGHAEDGGMVEVQEDGVGFASNNGVIGIGSNGTGFVSEGGQAIVFEGGSCNVEAGGGAEVREGGTCNAHEGGLVEVKPGGEVFADPGSKIVAHGGAYVKIMIQESKVEFKDGMIYLDDDIFVTGENEGPLDWDSVILTDITGRPVR